MAEHHSGRVVLNTAQGDEPPPLHFCSGTWSSCVWTWDGKTLRIGVKGWRGIAAQNPFLAPFPKVSGGAGIYVIFRIVFLSSTTEDDSDEVIRAGRVITILQVRRDLIVGLGYDVSGRDSLRIVAKCLERLNVSHGNL